MDRNGRVGAYENNYKAVLGLQIIDNNGDGIIWKLLS
jgi:hypothetical protein